MKSKDDNLGTHNEFKKLAAKNGRLIFLFPFLISPRLQGTDGHKRHLLACHWLCIICIQLKAQWSSGHIWCPAWLATQLADCCSLQRETCHLSQICTCRRSTKPPREHPAIQLLPGSRALWVILQRGTRSSWTVPPLVPWALSKTQNEQLFPEEEQGAHQAHTLQTSSSGGFWGAVVPHILR